MTDLVNKTEKPKASRFVFGPVPSRRLGASLGLDLVPLKTCTLDCQYCEVGRTTIKTVQRFNHDIADELLRELAEFISETRPDLDYITLAGSGEPTLNAEISDIIKGVREISDVDVAILTNGTLLFDRQVRQDLLGADLVIPSLDTAVEKTFQRLNRPHADLSLEKIIEGLVSFREEFSGRFYLEVLLARGINDSREELEALKAAMERINPDQIQLNTVFRPPAMKSAQPLSMAEMEKAAKFLGPKTDVSPEYREKETRKEDPEAGDRILELIGRRPCMAEDMAASLALPLAQVIEVLKELENQKKVSKESHAGKSFFRREPTY